MHCGRLLVFLQPRFFREQAFAGQTYVNLVCRFGRLLGPHILENGLMFDYFLVEVLLELLDLGRRLFEYLIDFLLGLFPTFHLTLDSKLFHVDGLGFFLKYVRLLL